MKYNYIGGFKNVVLILGNEYYLRKKLVKLIKVTAKGYNLLEIKNNRCMLKSPIYPSKTSTTTIANEIVFMFPRSWDIIPACVNKKKFFVFSGINGVYFYGNNEWGNFEWGMDITKIKLFDADEIEEIINTFKKNGENVNIGIL